MAHSRQAKKRIRQNDVRRVYNRSIKSELKTLTKRFRALVAAKDRDGAGALFPKLVSEMDKAGRKRIYHPNTIARRKSQVARLYNQLAGEGPSGS